MKATRCLFTFIVIISIATSCKKEPEVKVSSKNASLIVGRWMASQRHTLVYGIDDNSLLKDTTVYYDAAHNTNWWFEIYTTNGNAFVTGKPYMQNNVLKADTTAFLKYSINGSSLALKPNGGGSQTKSIQNLTETDMTLESIYNDLGRPFWGLDIRKEYHFVEQTSYIKQ